MLLKYELKAKLNIGERAKERLTRNEDPKVVRLRYHAGSHVQTSGRRGTGRRLKSGCVYSMGFCIGSVVEEDVSVMTKQETEKRLGEVLDMVSRIYINLMDEQRRLFDNLPKGGKVRFRRYAPFSAERADE